MVRRLRFLNGDGEVIKGVSIGDIGYGDFIGDISDSPSSTSPRGFSRMRFSSK